LITDWSTGVVAAATQALAYGLNIQEDCLAVIGRKSGLIYSCIICV